MSIGYKLGIIPVDNGSGPPLQASAQSVTVIEREMSRVGIQLRAADGRNKSVEALFAEISALNLPSTRRLELKIEIEHAVAGVTLR